MNEFKYIFEATNRIDVLKRFIEYNKKVYNLKKHQSENYHLAINTISEALKIPNGFSESDIKDACGYFTMAEQCNTLYDSLHAKFGELICHYILGNTLDVESIARNILNTKIPEKRNIKGIFVNIGKGVVVGTGLVVSFFPPAKMVGVAMVHHGRNLPTERLKVPDPEINKFISDIREVDFKNILNNIVNLK